MRSTIAIPWSLCNSDDLPGECPLYHLMGDRDRGGGDNPLSGATIA
ncbi:hypothetical protein LKK83_06545 [Phormidium sp. CCY1219]|nr:hypothetical protein [Phormidium sp. CCY1219]